MEERTWIRFPEFPDQFPLSTDSVLLADFAAVRGRKRVMDLGAGCGTLGLLLCAADAGCAVEGLELQRGSVQQAEEIIRLNNMEDRIRVTEGDLRRIREYYRPGYFDAVVSNPPYFPAGRGAASANEAIAIARTELCCTLEDVCSAAAWLLPTGAPFYLVHKPERLCDLMTALRNHRLEPKRMRFVRHAPAALPALVLIESRKGRNPGLSMMQDLILHREDGTETPEYRRIYGLEE